MTAYQSRSDNTNSLAWTTDTTSMFRNYFSRATVRHPLNPFITSLTTHSRRVKPPLPQSHPPVAQGASRVLKNKSERGRESRRAHTEDKEQSQDDCNLCGWRAQLPPGATTPPGKITNSRGVYCRPSVKTWAVCAREGYRLIVSPGARRVNEKVVSRARLFPRGNRVRDVHNVLMLLLLLPPRCSASYKDVRACHAISLRAVSMLPGSVRLFIISDCRFCWARRSGVTFFSIITSVMLLKDLQWI